MAEFAVSVTVYSGDPEMYVRRIGADALGTTDLDLDVIYTTDDDGGVMISGVVRTRSG